METGTPSSTGLALRYPPRVWLVHREDLIPVRNQVSVDQAGADMARKLSRHSAVSPDRPDSRPLGGQNRFRQIKKSLPHPLDQRIGLLQQVPDLRGAVNACPAEPPRQPAGAIPELGLQMLVLPPAFDVPAGAQLAGLAHRAAHRFRKQTVVDRMFDVGLHNKRIRFHIDRTAVLHDPVTELHDFIVDEPKRLLVEQLRQIVRDPGRLELIMVIRTLQHDPDFGMPAHLLKTVEVAVEPLLQNAKHKNLPETHARPAVLKAGPFRMLRLHVSQNRLTGLLVAVKRLQAAQQTGNVVPRLLVDLKLLDRNMKQLKIFLKCGSHGIILLLKIRLFETISGRIFRFYAISSESSQPQTAENSMHGKALNGRIDFSSRH